MKQYNIFNLALITGLILFLVWYSPKDNKPTTKDINHSKKYTLNENKSTLFWKGSWIKDGAIDHSHHGSIKISKGHLSIIKDDYFGSFTIDMASIKNLDLKDTSKINLLEGKLKGFNFFNVSLCPTTEVKLEKLNNKKAILTVTEFNISVTDTVPISLQIKDSIAYLKGEFNFNFSAMRMPAVGIKTNNTGISPIMQFTLNAKLNR